MTKTRGVLAVALLAVVGCAPARSTPETRYLGILQSARDQGAESLRLEAAKDPAIRDYVTRNGPPDFILVASPRDVELVYVDASRLVHFHRPEPDAPSVPTELSPIPSTLLHMLPRDLRVGTPTPLPSDTACWTVVTPDGPCRTCCATRQSCIVNCRP